MTVRFNIGHALDPTTPRPAKSTLGTRTTNPQALLLWLESQLGLDRPDISFSTRLIQYLTCLQQQNNDNRFYNESLKQDDIGVAKTLLQWRDEWYEAGWSGQKFPDTASVRLRDLGDVERLAAERVAPGIGQRVQDVLEALAETKLDVSLTLLDPPDTFPTIWRQLFEQLGAVPEPWQSTPQCTSDSDLAKLQRALIAQGKPVTLSGDGTVISPDYADEPVTLCGDGTVLILRDGSPQLSAPWIARFAHRLLDKKESVALLAPNHGPTLDDALTDAGFPRLGFTAPSFWRPMFQIMPLALELLWRPLDPNVLLQFLALPTGPLRAGIRRHLAKVVSEEPGIGGEAWLHAVDIALDEAVATDPPETAAVTRDRLAADIEFWLNTERFDPQSGAPIAVLIERVRRMGDWLAMAHAMQPDDAQDLHAAALHQATELLNTLRGLEASGVNDVERESVRRLIKAVRGTGVARPARPWQCQANTPQLQRADAPAALIEPVANVIWWGCDAPSLPGVCPWPRTEQEQLADHGVDLLSVHRQLEWQAGSWLRPVLSATERLVLVLHDNAESHHPIVDQLVAVAEGWAELRIDKIMREPSLLPLPDRLPTTRAITPRQLPAKTRWWQLPDDAALPTRDMESYSSLEKFIYAPYQWVLHYQARLRPGVLVELNDGNRLKGSLAHRLFEQFFAAHADFATLLPTQVDDWAHTRVRELIEQSGAVLLMPGRHAEMQEFVDTAVRSLGILVQRLSAADVVQVTMEAEHEGRFGGGAMQGKIDLHAVNARGESAVVDIKWSGYQYRQDALKDSRYLQLAVYAQLCKQNTDQFPALGFFVIRESRLLMLERDFFPDTQPIIPANNESPLEFWQRVEHTWQWRRAQLDDGLVEVTVTGTEPDERSAAGELGLPMPETFDAFDDYGVLAGWSDDA